VAYFLMNGIILLPLDQDINKNFSWYKTGTGGGTGNSERQRPVPF
jgi:hypothetical protein